MINRLADEINKALDAELYLVALCTALTLPDICGKAEFPDERSSAIRYKTWYENHIGQYEKCPSSSDDMPYLSDEIVYNLRCSLLHQGNPNVDKNKTNVDEFHLIVQRMNGLEIYVDTSSVIMHADGTRTRTIKVNIKNLCWKLCSVAQNYYEKNKNKFNFFNYTIIDMNQIFPFEFRID